MKKAKRKPPQKQIQRVKEQSKSPKKNQGSKHPYKQKQQPNSNKIVFNWLLIFAILIVTYVAYFPSFENDFTNWDDNSYVVENMDIRDLSAQNISHHFKDFHMGNYHPLTMISFAVNYSFGKLNANHYQFTNILLHLFNTVLVFWIVYSLFSTKQWKLREINTGNISLKMIKTGALSIAFISSFLFGVNTIHVESVTWISERKDVLYAFFFLSSLFAYVKYLETNKIRNYFIAIVLFILSLFSKGQAVSLAATIVLLDFITRRKLLSKKVILEKVPFFVLAILFGIIAVSAQEATGAIQDIKHLSFFKKMLFASYGYSQYLIKMLIPVNLSALYAYPKMPDGTLPLKYWLHLGPTLLIIATMVFTLKKEKMVAFGLLFFSVNVFLVLQLLQVGGAVMADRYSYIPSVGFFILIAYGYWRLTSKKPSLKIPLLTAIVAYGLFLSVLTFQRTQIWQNSETLWSDVLDKNPRVSEALVNRAKYRYDHKNLKDALTDFDNALVEKPNLVEALTGRGVIKRNLGDLQGAITDYNKAIAIKPKNAEAYSNRGVTKINLNDLQGAVEDFNKAIELDPGNFMAISNSGGARFKLKDFKGAIELYTKAIELRPDYPEAFANRGSAKSELGNFEGALSDLSKAIQLKPDYTTAYLNRALVKYEKIKDYPGAIQDCTTLISIKPDSQEAYYIRALARKKSGLKDEACADFKKSAGLGYVYAKNDIDTYCH